MSQNVDRLHHAADNTFKDKYQKINPAVHCRAHVPLKNTRLLCIFGHFECFSFWDVTKNALK